jgi:hypothetical protein
MPGNAHRAMSDCENRGDMFAASHRRMIFSSDKDVDAVSLLATMASLSCNVPAIPVARAVLALAGFLTAHRTGLSAEQSDALLTLGAGLWQRSVILDDTVDEIDAMLATILGTA